MAVLIPASSSPELAGKAKDAYMLREKGYLAEDIANISGMYPGYNTHLEYIDKDTVPMMNIDQMKKDRAYPLHEVLGVSSDTFKFRPDIEKVLGGYSDRHLGDGQQSYQGIYISKDKNVFPSLKDYDLILAKGEWNALSPGTVGHELRHHFDKDLLNTTDFYDWNKPWEKRKGEIVAEVSAKVAPKTSTESVVEAMREAYKYGLPDTAFKVRAQGKSVKPGLKERAYDALYDSGLPESAKRLILGDSLYYDMHEQRR